MTLSLIIKKTLAGTFMKKVTLIFLITALITLGQTPFLKNKGLIRDERGATNLAEK